MVKENKMMEILKIDEEFIISDLDTLKVISDPFRLELMEAIALENEKGRLVTVKHLAQQFDKPPTKLYYHINLLEKHELIRVADTQIVSGIIEKHYQTSAQTISVDRHLFSKSEMDEDEAIATLFDMLNALFDSSLNDIRKSIQVVKKELVQPKIDIEREDSPLRSLHLSWEKSYLSETQATEFHRRLKDLVHEFEDMEVQDERGNDSMYFGLVTVLYPAHHMKNDEEENNHE
jgi:DNA-binding transcriptional ArsR family regulator